MENVDPEFAKRISTLINENVLQYGTQLTPVVQAEFPSTGIPSDNMQNVTCGETKPLGEPREDENAAVGKVPNEEVMSEISSLLVTIGFILSKEGCVPDKFNTSAIVTFLSKHFPQNANVPQDIDQPPVEGGAVIPAQPVSNPLMESRQILEKQWTKK